MIDVRTYCREDARRFCADVDDWTGQCFSYAYSDCLGVLRLHPYLKDYLAYCDDRCDGNIDCVIKCMDIVVKCDKATRCKRKAWLSKCVEATLAKGVKQHPCSPLAPVITDAIRVVIQA